MYYPILRMACCCAFISIFVSACAGKGDAAPTDVQTQAFRDLRTEISAAVDDPERAKQAVRVISILEQDLEELRENIAARRQRVLALNADYDTPRSEFESYFKAVNSEILESRQSAIESYRELSTYMTEDELKAISKSQSKAMKAFSRTIGSI